MRSEVTWPTVPAMVRDAAHRFADAEAVVDGSRRIGFASLSTRVGEAARALLASGIERGDRIAVWAPNSLEWIVAALGVTTAGGVLVPVNTRFRGAEAAFILARSRARVLVHGARLSRHRLPGPARDRRHAASRARADGPAVRRRRRRCGRLGGVPRTGARRARGRARAAPRGHRSRRSQRRRVHVGDHRKSEGRGDDPRPDAARLPRLVRLCGPAPGRPLSHREPVLPHLRLQGRPAGVAHARRHDAAARGVRRECRARADRARADHGAARTADDLPVPARPSRPHPPRPLEPARRRDGCGGHPGASSSAGCASSCRSSASSPDTG